VPFRRRRTSSRRGGRPIRNREWIAFTTSTSETSGFAEPRTLFISPGGRAVNWIIDPQTARDEWDEPTVVRALIRSTLFIAGTPTQISTGGYRATLRGGLITWKASVTDPALGDLSLDGLNPSDGEMDWLWWDEQHLWYQSGQYIGTEAFAGSQGDQNGKMDIRAKRKLEIGSGLVAAFELIADSTSVGVWFHFDGRILLLNH